MLPEDTVLGVTPKSATDPALYQPDPVMLPTGESMLRKYCFWYVATTEPTPLGTVMFPDCEMDRPEAETQTYWHPVPHPMMPGHMNECVEPIVNVNDRGRLE